VGRTAGLSVAEPDTNACSHTEGGGGARRGSASGPAAPVRAARPNASSLTDTWQPTQAVRTSWPDGVTAHRDASIERRK
jgi:hypothetical protein